jgi:aminoglycoside phosphotransferase family enzyme
VAFLSDAANLGETGNIELIETHFAWVFLGARFAYKLRKPVRYHDLDTLTRESRRAMCEAELRLNVALAPGIYLQIVRLTRSSEGRLRLGGTGEPLDWLIKMRRLPRSRMLDTLIRDRTLRPDDLGPLADRLRRFYESAKQERTDGPAYRKRLRKRVTANRNQLLAHCDSKRLCVRVRALAELQEQFIITHGPLLAERAESGYIRDCHGDLRPEHVCLGPPLCVIDRLEFDRALRLLDPLEELCFLGLECARLGAPAIGDWLVARCAPSPGAPASAHLLGFYTSLQATTRAVLRAWRLTEGTHADRSRWRGEIRDYLERALTAIREAASGSRDLPGSAAPFRRASRRTTRPTSHLRQLAQPAGSERYPSLRFRR